MNEYTGVVILTSGLLGFIAGRTYPRWSWQIECNLPGRCFRCRRYVRRKYLSRVHSTHAGLVALCPDCFQIEYKPFGGAA